MIRHCVNHSFISPHARHIFTHFFRLLAYYLLQTPDLLDCWSHVPQTVSFRFFRFISLANSTSTSPFRFMNSLNILVCAYVSHIYNNNLILMEQTTCFHIIFPTISRVPRVRKIYISSVDETDGILHETKYYLLLLMFFAQNEEDKKKSFLSLYLILPFLRSLRFHSFIRYILPLLRLTA